MARLRDRYKEEIMPALMTEFSYKNIMQVPKLEKVVVNMRLGDCKDNPKLMESAVAELAQITGQNPIVIKAKRSVSNLNGEE